MSAISKPFIAGRLSDDLDGMSLRLSAYIRKRAGRRCTVWVSEDGEVTIGPSSVAPDFGDDAAPLVGVYLHKAGETFWRDRLREALAYQAASMQVAA